MEPLTKNTALSSFINHKNETNMQCGNYTIDLPELKSGEQYRFVFDATACVGCHCCEVACNEQNANPDDIKWRRVGEMEAGVFPDTLQLFNSMSCNHCIDPECLKGCPTNAYIKLENGIVFHDDPNCIGCQYCTWNCPYEVPTFNKDRGIVTKCHMCVDKLEVGQTPACVQACPANAINIEVVNVDKWLNEDMAKEGVAPHLPDIEITKPTTRYILPSLPEGAEFKPADEHLLKPAHPEFPLIFMTVLTQASVGAFVAIFLGQFLYSLGFNLPAPTATMVFFALALAGVGLPLSALHLGRPSKAIWAMRNYKTSWLSREAIALGAYAGVAGLVWLMYLFDFNGFLKLLFEAIGVALGVYGIYAQSKIYRIKARPSWNRESTTKRFFGTGYIGFLIVSFLLLLSNQASGAFVLLAITLLVGAGQYLIINDEVNFYKYLNREHKNYYQLNRTKKLLFEHFKKLKTARVHSLRLFAIAMPLLTILFSASGNYTIASVILFIAIIGSFVSEIIGRYLFYVTVVPLGLAGNFFAGNQR